MSNHQLIQGIQLNHPAVAVTGSATHPLIVPGLMTWRDHKMLYCKSTMTYSNRCHSGHKKTKSEPGSLEQISYSDHSIRAKRQQLPIFQGKRLDCPSMAGPPVLTTNLHDYVTSIPQQQVAPICARHHLTEEMTVDFRVRRTFYMAVDSCLLHFLAHLTCVQSPSVRASTCIPFHQEAPCSSQYQLLHLTQTFPYVLAI